MTAEALPAGQPLRTTKETHPNLPPGLVLGPDGKPCKVCNSWQDWAKMKVKKKDDGAGTAPSTSKTAAGATAAAAAVALTASTSTSTPASADARANCPPDTAALGRATWMFLHTTAAYYPLTASKTQQTQMRSLLTSLPGLYPCTWCADDFGKDIVANPPDVTGRAGLSKWLCERHNEVNRKLGKTEFGCGEKNLAERWKDGPADGSCD